MPFIYSVLVFDNNTSEDEILQYPAAMTPGAAHLRHAASENAFWHGFKRVDLARSSCRPLRATTLVEALIESADSETPHHGTL